MQWAPIKLRSGPERNVTNSRIKTELHRIGGLAQLREWEFFVRVAAATSVYALVFCILVRLLSSVLTTPLEGWTEVGAYGLCMFGAGVVTHCLILGKSLAASSLASALFAVGCAVWSGVSGFWLFALGSVPLHIILFFLCYRSAFRLRRYYAKIQTRKSS